MSNKLIQGEGATGGHGFMEYWLIVLWMFVLGGVVGSFLNVVVYRLPLGISIVYPPSRCPKCGKRIAWYDNVPVLGWIALRGRCRQCQNPISVRYPVVEAVTATMFGLLAVAELPYMSRIGFYGLYPYHLLLLCTLLCAGLIEYDGNRVPVKLFLPALVVGITTPLICPALRPLWSWIEFPMWEGSLAWLIGTVDGLAGLIAGAIFGGLAWGMIGGERPRGLFLGLLCVGLFLGWQAATVIAMCTAVLIAPMWLPERVSPRLRIPSSLIFGIVTLAWILAWAILASP